MLHHTVVEKLHSERGHINNVCNTFAVHKKQNVGVFFCFWTGQNSSAVHYKTIRDPAVQKGKPLPEKGTCKHYKQSHRWLRYHDFCVLKFHWSDLKRCERWQFFTCTDRLQVSLLWPRVPLWCLPWRRPGPPHGTGHEDDLWLLCQRTGER